MERVVRIFDGHEAAAEADRQYYASLSPQERLNLLLDLQERYRAGLGEAGQRFERVCRITALGEG